MVYATMNMEHAVALQGITARPAKHIQFSPLTRTSPCVGLLRHVSTRTQQAAVYPPPLLLLLLAGLCCRFYELVGCFMEGLHGHLECFLQVFGVVLAAGGCWCPCVGLCVV